MNKNTGIIIGVIVLIMFVGWVYTSMNNENNTLMKDGVEDTTMIQEETNTMMKDNKIKDDSMMKKDDTGMMMKGSYESYSPEKLAMAETGDVVLFFHASWCPSCRSLNSDIEANSGSIPEGVSILKVDYDKETELKKKYGVTYQHTLVQVDKNGNLIKKWSGNSKLANLVSEIK